MPRLEKILAIITLWCLAQLAVAEELPIVFQDDFENGASRWQPQDEKQFKIKKTDSGNVYSQFEKKSNYKPPHRAPTNVSLQKDVVVSDMEFTGRVQSTHPNYGHRDAVVFFQYQDPAHFYYVHLGKKADDHGWVARAVMVGPDVCHWPGQWELGPTDNAQGGRKPAGWHGP